MKYRIKNIDCAACANKLEIELGKRSEIDNIHIDPLNSILETDMTDINKLRGLIRNIEPAAEIEKINPEPVEVDKNFRREIIQIITVVVLLVTGLLFEARLNEQFFGGADTVIYLAAYFISGWSVLSKAFRNILKGKIFDEHFLMTIATAGAIAINQIPEAVTVMLFYNVGEYLQGTAVQRNRRSIKKLLSYRPDFANLIVGSDVLKVLPEEVKVNDLIIIKPGEKVPLDGWVQKGSSYVDTFMLTGESVPRKIKEGEEILSGMINQSGSLTIQVTRNFSESSFSKIIDLVEGASKKKAVPERFISRFAYYYTPVVVSLAILAAFLPPLIFTGQSLQEWIYRALVMLVVSCPCALVISIPLGYFGGIGGASRKGILIKGSGFLDALTEIKTVVFDKTGTLTKGVFKVTEVIPANGFDREELLKYAAHAELLSAHPIAQSVVRSFPENIDQTKISDFREIPGKGIEAIVGGQKVLAGNETLLKEKNIFFDDAITGSTLVHVAINKVYAGYLVISDEIKVRALDTIRELDSRGIKKIMLTGDIKSSAAVISQKLNIDEYYSGLLPEDKVVYLEKIMSENAAGKTAFAGDGINDAPVIARSDIGFAMGGLGSDAAVEAADIVIMEDDPYKIIEALNIADKTRLIVWQNIFFTISIKLIFIILGGMGIATMWEAVFGDMGVALIAILNASRSFRN